MDNTAFRISENDPNRVVCEVLLHDEREEGYFFDKQFPSDTNLSHLAEEAREFIEEDIASHSVVFEGFCFDDLHSYHTSDGAVLIFKKLAISSNGFT